MAIGIATMEDLDEIIAQINILRGENAKLREDFIALVKELQSKSQNKK